MANRKMPKANRACKICGTTPITGYKYCDGCKREAHRRAKERQNHKRRWHPWFGVRPYAKQCAARANRIAKTIRCCEACGGFFQPAVPSERQLKGQSDWGRFCSIVCRDEPMRQATQLRTARTRIVRLLAGRRTCRSCSETFTTIHPQQQYCSRECAAYRPSKPSRPCKECGTEFAPAYGDSRRAFCGEACLKRHYRRIRRSRERARHRAAKVEPVNPRTVFERDGYRCQLCGYKTLRAKRGSYHPKAPELDHIVPLAQGGEHSYRNTQCACRACNMAKSDGAGGQLLLIGEHA